MIRRGMKIILDRELKPILRNWDSGYIIAIILIINKFQRIIKER